MHPSHPPSPPQHGASPPSRRDLADWWKRFKKTNPKKEEDKHDTPVGIFGVPLQVSIKYANVAISLTNEKGESYIYGYVPIVVAKCGVYLKENATEIEGIFRLSGSAKRIKELQTIFDSPDRYGKGLDWTGYTVHDAANILRRYLNQLPQPIVPLDFYERCRDPLRSHQTQAVGDIEAQAQAAGEFDHEAAIIAYQKLLTEIPPLNRQLLLYILDLLAVFASKSEQNRMTSANLAAIFQPGLLSHPNHDMSPSEYRLSQDVLIFLIENQDNFLVGMSGTAADENTVAEVQRGVQRQQNTPTRASQAGLGRSASNASAGADSLRRNGGTRRNLSISSRNSKGSNHVPSPASPAAGSPLVNASPGNGVYRSNTVPSKRSPGLPSSRFARANGEADHASSSRDTPGPVPSFARSPSPAANLPPPAENTAPAQLSEPAAEQSFVAPPTIAQRSRNMSRDVGSTEALSMRSPEHGVTTTITSGTPNKERKLFFSKSPTSDADRKDGKGPKKLRKKSRAQTTSNNASAQSSTHSLHGANEHRFPHSPLVSPAALAHSNHDPMAVIPPIISNTDASPSSEQAPQLGDIDKMSAFHLSHHSGSPAGSPALRASRSPVPSLHSRSAAEDSEVDHTDEGTGKEGKKSTGRWRLSSTHKPHRETLPGSHAGSRLGSQTVAERSETSLGSGGKPKKSETFDSQQTHASAELSTAAGTHVSSNDSTPSKEKDADDKERKGPIGWLKAKVAQAKEEREERKADKEAEKERAKSPPPAGGEHTASKNSLHASMQEVNSPDPVNEPAVETNPKQPASTAEPPKDA